MSAQETPALRSRYGAWAVVAGATEGVGRAFARSLAAAGMDVMLLARREEGLKAVAAELRATYPVAVETLAVDLSALESTAAVMAALGERDLGALVYNAGSDTAAARFVDTSMVDWASLIARNISSLTSLTHAFATRMAGAGRGAIVLVCSEAALGGADRVSVYSATKAFGLNLGESLWAELKPRGVDVLSIIIGATDTPTLRHLVSQKGIDPDTLALAQPQDIADQALAHLHDGPTFVFSEGGSSGALGAARRRHTEATSALMATFYN